MPNYIVSSHGPFEDLRFVGHESAEAYNAEAGAPDQERFPGYESSLLADADGAIVAWSTLPTFGRNFAKTVAEKTGIPRRVNEKALAKAKERAKNPDDVKPEKYLETTVDYFNFVFESIDDQKKAELRALAKEFALTVKVDASPSAKGSRGPSKGALDAADTVLALPEEQREAKITKWQNVLAASDQPEFDLQRDPETNVPTRDSLAYMAVAVMKAL